MNLKRHAITCLTAAAGCLLFIGGCGQPDSRELLVVNFQPNKPLLYRFTSSRQVTIDLKGTPEGREDSKTSKETLEMVMEITPTAVDPFGMSTLQFTCKSVKASRGSFTGKASGADAIENLKNKSYTVRVSPTGQTELTESFLRLLRDTGQKSFIESTKQNVRVKEPEMIFDWVFFQKNLWDAPASIEKPLAGLNVGSQWQSTQFMPWPVPISNIPTRVTTYRLAAVSGAGPDRKAIIDSSYELSEEMYTDIPLPYEGSYQIKGSLFSVLINYRHESLEGSGTQTYNLDRGTLESDHQEYTLVTRADFILPLGGTTPYVTVKQTFDIQRIDEGAERTPSASQ